VNQEEFQIWKTDPLTKKFLNYLQDVCESMTETHKAYFQEGMRVDDESFYRDSERFITLSQIINLDHVDIEEFYGQLDSSMGKPSRITGQD